MTTNDSGKTELRVHPIIAKLVPGARMATGYIGNSSEKGIVRLHLSLVDISNYLEFRESDILHVLAPTGSGIERDHVWLKPNAEIRLHEVTRLEGVPDTSDSENATRKLNLSADTILHLTAEDSGARPTLTTSKRPTVCRP